jgi:hypothetical protein
MFAGGILGILALLFSLGSLICFVIVLIKQFQDAGAIQGIIGIITCGIWTFIWGWMNASRLNIKNIMLIWTALLVIGIILRVILFSTVGVPYPAGTPVRP